MKAADMPQRRLRPDPRAARTRAAVVTAFNRLVFTRGYEDLSASSIAAEANVSRSTFYAHFRDRDAVLVHAVGQVFARLAQACVQSRDDGTVEMLCEHFWQERTHARTLLTERRGGALNAVLAQEFRAAFARESENRGALKSAQLRNEIAIYLASASLGVLRAWLSGKIACSPSEIASTLRAGSQSILAAYSAA